MKKKQLNSKRKRQIMDSALSSVVKEYGDIENYLKSIGLTKDNLIKLKDRLLK